MNVIVNYDMGNVGSIFNMIRRLGYDVTVSSNLNEIAGASKLILPGVGAFDVGAQKFQDMNLLPLLNKLVINGKVPCLGICLGMQLMTKSSEEGRLKGLGWFDANTVKFKFFDQKMKIPHMGWNFLRKKKESTLLQGIDQNFRFYFVHSFYVVCNQKQDVLTTTNYGDDFVSSIQKDNIFGVQFHPEKSHQFGMTILKNFLSL